MFVPHTSDNGGVPPFEYHEVSAITPKLGMLLDISNGKLAIASASAKPQYVSCVETAAALTAGDIIPVMRVQEEIVYETVLTANGADLLEGDKVTIAATGMGVTATTVDSSSNPIGVAEIVGFPKGTKASGDPVLVRF